MLYPLFPLPQVVMMPGMVRPFHIFEPRYRQLMEHVLSEDEPQFVMSMLHCRDEMDYYLNPKFESIGCIVEVIDHHQNANGTYDISVMGLIRVELEEGQASDQCLYRQVQAEPLIYPENDCGAGEWLMDHKSLIKTKIGVSKPIDDIYHRLNEGVLTSRSLLNILLSSIETDPNLLQDVLESDEVDEMIRRLESWLELKT
jgi:Lon protease-like protein